VLYSIRSERLVLEQLDFNLLFRWLVGLNDRSPVFEPGLIPEIMTVALPRGTVVR